MGWSWRYDPTSPDGLEEVPTEFEERTAERRDCERQTRAATHREAFVITALAVILSSLYLWATWGGCAPAC